jgi:hypothetical protein
VRNQSKSFTYLIPNGEGTYGLVTESPGEAGGHEDEQERGGRAAPPGPAPQDLPEHRRSDPDRGPHRSAPRLPLSATITGVARTLAGSRQAVGRQLSPSPIRASRAVRTGWLPQRSARRQGRPRGGRQE